MCSFTVNHMVGWRKIAVFAKIIPNNYISGLERGTDLKFGTWLDIDHSSLHAKLQVNWAFCCLKND